MGRKKSPPQTTTQSTAPWSGQQPFLKDVMQEAKKQYRAPGPTFFPGQTYAPTAPQTERALSGMERQATAGSPIQRGAEDLMQQTLRGDYLYGGPGFDRALTAAQNRIIPAVESRFNSAGRFGSGLAREAETRALGDAFAGQYGQERQAQQQAMQMAPEMAQSRFQDMGVLKDVGQQREAIRQQAIDEAVRRHEFAQEQPERKLGVYSNIVTGQNMGQEGTTQQHMYGGSRLGGLLGGAMGGAKLGAALGGAGSGAASGAATGGMFGGPIGAVPGAVLGGLAGLF